MDKMVGTSVITFTLVRQLSADFSFDVGSAQNARVAEFCCEFFWLIQLRRDVNPKLPTFLSPSPSFYFLFFFRQKEEVEGGREGKEEATGGLVTQR